MRSREELIEYINGGNRVKYVFFWGHQEKKGVVSKACFSQWYESSFEVNGVSYKTPEHFMMAEKARLFGDEEAALKIVGAKNPGEAKKLGRLVSHFNEQIWIDNRFEIVVKANRAKFDQNVELKEFLLNTGERVIVEASPIDRIWGIGLPQDSAAASNPAQWKGLSLLGFALMEVRRQLSR